VTEVDRERRSRSASGLALESTFLASRRSAEERFRIGPKVHWIASRSQLRWARQYTQSTVITRSHIDAVPCGSQS
jgi:hypothetical protein